MRGSVGLLLLVVLGCGGRSPSTSSSSGGSKVGAQTELETDTHRGEVEQVELTPPPAPIDLSGYDRSCKRDADCVIVEPQPCAKCGCASEPIAARERQRLQETIAAVECAPHHLSWDIECVDCVEATPWCDGGQCKAKPGSW